MLDDLMDEREIGMVASSGVTGLKKNIKVISDGV